MATHWLAIWPTALWAGTCSSEISRDSTGKMMVRRSPRCRSNCVCPDTFYLRIIACCVFAQGALGLRNRGVFYRHAHEGS